MKRAGFTMIELIFVIVILGILAAVAIPKLAATRSDAEGAKIAGDLATCIGDAGGNYLKEGNFTINTDADGTAWTVGNTETPACDSAISCFTIVAYDVNGTMTVVATTADATATKACVEAQSLAEGNQMSAAKGSAAAVHSF